MALLQITEPGEVSTRQKIAIGIDLGTTHSLVAVVQDGKPYVLCDEKEQPLLPSIVRYLSNQIIIGQEAKLAASIDPANTIASVKRFMGRSQQDLTTYLNKLPYEFSPQPSGMLKIKTAQGEKSPVEISAEILKVLKDRAESQLGNIDGAVVTVPAYFDDAQRQATKDAAKLAGLPLLRLLNEPTAAAIAYGLDKKSKGIHVIYDLGGGTFDISILKLKEGVFEVLATGGDTALGGDDMDYAVADWALSQLNIQSITSEQKQELLKLSRHAKEQLSAIHEYAIHWQGQTIVLTQGGFNQLIAGLLERTLVICRRAISDAKLALSDIDAVILVGGATRVPLVRSIAGEFFKQKPLTDIDPDQVVALGAAIQANQLIGNNQEDSLLLLDVLPLSLGLETMGGLVEKIIERNTSIPVAKTQQFTTYQDGQTGMLIHVVQGERELVKDCRSLASFELTGIPPMKAGAARIEILFEVNADGLLNVSARELTTGKESRVSVKPSYGLTDEDIEQMIISSYTHAKEDVAARMLAEKTIEAQQLIDLLTIALREDGERYLSSEEKERLAKYIEKLKQAIHGKQRELIESAYKELDEASQLFAQRRMEGSLQAALKGKNIEEFLNAKD